MGPDVAQRLRSALAGRYDVEGEIGRGGMAMVFLAQDTRHDRRVAIKVIRPELVAAVGRSRFIREIEVVAQLSHPHILPLFDSGEVDDLLFYVMPYVEGESLRDRLQREGQLTVEDAIATACEIADALSHAHSRGILHRDIKPENVMLSGGHALVADFGIARAFGDTGTERLTETGLALGTPWYMSPEQASGERRIDGRSDLYSLGCVLFEALVGEPPFTGPTPRAIMARHALEAVPSVRITRAAVPESVESALRKALEKVPADRFPTVVAFADALRGASARWPPRPVLRRLALAVAGLAVVVGAAATIPRMLGKAPAVALDESVIAVLPFRESGVIDTTVITPVEVVEHLYARLPGGGGPRALEPGLVLPAWRSAVDDPADGLSVRDATRLAATLGAGLVLTGRIHGTTDDVAFDATVLRADGGEVAIQIGRVSGPPDSLTSMLDRLAVEVLVRIEGEALRLPDLAHRPIAAVRSYLNARRRYAEGRYRGAAEGLNRALNIDSTFGLAGLILDAVERSADGASRRGLRAAYANRTTLGPADSIYLLAVLGPRYPATSSIYDRVRQWEQLDGWEASFELGRLLLGAGGQVGLRERPTERAREALKHATQIRPRFVPAVEGLFEIAARLGEESEVARLGAVLLSADTLGDRAPFVQWRAAIARSDTVELAALRSQLPQMPTQILEQILGSAQLDGVAMDDAVQAAATLQAGARNQREAWWSSVLARGLALNRGRPLEAREAMTEDPITLPANEFMLVVEALHWDGDTALAGSAARRSQDRLANLALRQTARATDLCTVTLWQLAHGATAGVAEAVEYLRPSDSSARSGTGAFMPVCAALLDARLATSLARPDATAALERLDSLMRVGPETNSHLLFAATVTVAALRERQSNLTAALSAVRRRSLHYSFGRTGLSTLLREEGRLAALTGDREGAIRAYRHYLALRSEPEPALRRQVAQVREHLDRLLGDPASR